MKDEGLSFPEAVRELARRFGVEMPRRKLDPAQQKAREDRDRQRHVLETAGEYFHTQLKMSSGRAALNYLTEKRGLTPEVIEEFQLGWAPDQWEGLGRFLRSRNISEELAVESGLLIKRDKRSGCYDRFRGRVMVPIKDATGRLVSFGGRILDQGEPKYMNGPESLLFKKNSTLFNLDKARREMRKKSRALLVEGYFDVITLHAHGLGEAVAPMGTALTSQQVARLKHQADELILVFDGDEAGIKAALRALPVFQKEDMGPKVILLPKGEDPDSLVRKKGAPVLEELLGQARPLVEMALLETVKNGDAKSVEGRSSILKQAGRIVCAIKDPVNSWLYLERLAAMLSIPCDIAAKQLGIPLPVSQKRPRLTAVYNRGCAGGGLKLNDQECLLQMILTQPEAARLFASHEEALEFLDDRNLRQVGASVLSVLARGADPTPDAVAQSLEDQSLAPLVSRLAQSGLELDADKARQETGLLLRQWQKRHLKKKLRDMSNQIAQAYQRGDKEEVARLQAMRQRISKSHPTL
jgi:DNA primase